MLAAASVEIEAVVYPKCLCGRPWVEHGTCGGYRPSGPVRDFGTVAFNHPRLLPRLLWSLEKAVKAVRKWSS